MDYRSETRKMGTLELFLQGWLSVTGTDGFMPIAATSVDGFIEILEDNAEATFGPAAYEFQAHPDNLLNDDVYRHYGADLARRFMHDPCCDQAGTANEVAHQLISNYAHYPPFYT